MSSCFPSHPQYYNFIPSSHVNTLNSQLGRNTLPGRHHILRNALIPSLVQWPHIRDKQIATVDDFQPGIVRLSQLVQLQFDVVLLPYQGRLGIPFGRPALQQRRLSSGHPRVLRLGTKVFPQD